MTIDLTGLVRPHVVEMSKRDDHPFAADFRLQPLERGYGHTLGNAMRRMLLSSLRGSAVWGVRLEGVVHEHQTIPGVAEDIHTIIQRIKGLSLTLAEGVDEATLHLKASKIGPVCARDIEPHGSVEIIDPDYVLFTLQEDRDISGELFVNKGRGYVEASRHSVDKSRPVDLVRVDAIYNPVRRANFTVAETRVGQRTDYDSLVLSVETDGTISPEDAVAYAAGLLQEYLLSYTDFGVIPMVPGETIEEDGQDMEAVKVVLARPIDDCGLSVRSINSLKNSNIGTLGDLVKYQEDDMLKVKNVGEKALSEIAELLTKEGLNFGMEWDEDPATGKLSITNEGTPSVRGGGSVAAEG
jgi:DNA-directed RNA polymerase subunit alpha